MGTNIIPPNMAETILYFFTEHGGIHFHIAQVSETRNVSLYVSRHDENCHSTVLSLCIFRLLEESKNTERHDCRMAVLTVARYVKRDLTELGDLSYMETNPL